MLTFIKDLLPNILTKIKSWKHVVFLLSVFLLAILFNLLMRIDINAQLTTTKLLITENVAKEINVKREQLVAKTIAISPTVDSLINKILDNINKEFKFNRSAIWLYHDNITMANGIPYSRMSMSHERINESKIKVTPQITMMQNIPISVFSYINKALFRDEYICATIESIRTSDQNSYHRYLEEHIIGYSAYLIRELDTGKPLAILMSYSYDTPLKCSKELYIHLKVQACVIENLLNYNQF